MNIYQSQFLTIQYRFPRSKKKRIRNKWAKRPENFRADPKVYQFNGAIYGHPETIRNLAAVVGGAERETN